MTTSQNESVQLSLDFGLEFTSLNIGNSETQHRLYIYDKRYWISDFKISVNRMSIELSNVGIDIWQTNM